MKKILVTGGAGFIGSHMCLALLEKGYKVVVIDSLVNSNSKSLEKVLEICKSKKLKVEDKLTFYKCDLRDKQSIEKVFLDSNKNDQAIDGVIHFAGIKKVDESVKNPILYWDTNIISSLNLLKVMDTNNCKTIVFSSSATIYGNANKELIDENQPLKPINPYGNSKLAIETILLDIFNSSPTNWSIINLRYFNPIGAHESGLIGESPLKYDSNIFPIILKVAYGELPELKVFGKNWNTKDGTCVRDYIHVMDLVDGHLLALEHLFLNKGKIINLNLGTGKGNSVLDLINSFQEANKIKIIYKFTEKRKGDVGNVVANNTLSKTILNWNPKRDIFDMCRDGWKWKKRNPYGYS